MNRTEVMTLTPALIEAKDAELTLSKQTRVLVHQDAVAGRMFDLANQVNPEDPRSLQTQHNLFLDDPSAYTIVFDEDGNEVAHIKVTDWLRRNEAGITGSSFKRAKLQMEARAMGQLMPDRPKWITSLVSLDTLPDTDRYDLHLLLLQRALSKVAVNGADTRVLIFHHDNDPAVEASRELNFEFKGRYEANGVPGVEQNLYVRPAELKTDDF